MNPYETTKEMLDKITAVKQKLPEVYDFLPRNDYYRLKQLVDEAEILLSKHK
ncbi:MAG: hypothetical protein KGH65_02210 [Candidatus Micrarchaeota archaeon]|nr:hypothetical protein [Candidatus Micrarchaeota archaeon]